MAPPRPLTSDPAEMAATEAALRPHLAHLLRIGRAGGDAAARKAARELAEAWRRAVCRTDAQTDAAPVRAAAALLARLPADRAAFHVGSLYTRLLPAAQRGRLGAFYTPPPLAEHLLELCGAHGADWGTARVIDPSCGGGAFLLPVALRIWRARPDTEDAGAVLDHLARHLAGVDVDPFACWMAGVALEIALRPLALAAGRPVPQMVRCGDALALPAAPDWDLVVGNPPYGRARLPAPLRARFERSLFGHANLYGLFTDLALQLCRPGGRIAYVTPTSFLGGQYFKSLRRLLLAEAPPAAIDFVRARKGVFEDVLQETALSLFARRPAADAGSVAVGLLEAGADAAPARHPLGRHPLPADGEAPWLLPRDAAQQSLAGRLALMPHRLRDLGYAVSTGPLVWNRHKEQLKRRPGRDRHPLVWAETVTAAGLLSAPGRRGKAPYAHVAADQRWLLLTSPALLVRRTTAREQARRLVAAPVPPALLARTGGVVVENHLNMVLAARAPDVGLATLAALLNSTAADLAFRCLSGSVAVSAYELERLPLPAPAALAAVEALVSAGAPAAAVDAAISRLYGLPPS